MEEPVLIQDWWIMPEKLIGNILRLVCEEYGSTEEIAQAFSNFALTCKAWMRAARSSTHLCFNITDRRHLEVPPLCWFANKTLEVLMLDRDMLDSIYEDHRRAIEAQANDEELAEFESLLLFDWMLLANPNTRENSVRSLQVLMNISFKAVPLLSPYTNLRKLSLYAPPDAMPSLPRDMISTSALSSLASLPRLTYLALTGCMEDIDWGSVSYPPSIEYLSIDIMEPRVEDELENGSNLQLHQFYVPPSLVNLQALSIRARCLVVDWANILASCPQIQVYSQFIGLLTQGGELNNPLRFAQQLVESPVMAEQLEISFAMMVSNPVGSSISEMQRESPSAIDVDELLTVLREVTAGHWDVDPGVDEDKIFSHLSPRIDAFYVLTMEKQPDLRPRSYHFTTPVTNEEIQLLKTHPAWRLVWCKDEKTAEILADIDFIRLNRNTLSRLSCCYFNSIVDLRPFEALISIHCTIESTHVLEQIRFPAGLTYLSLEAPQLSRQEEGEDLLLIAPEIALLEQISTGEGFTFNANYVTGLSSLKELTLTGFSNHDVLNLMPEVTYLQIINPGSIQEETRREQKVFGCDNCRLPLSMLLDSKPALHLVFVDTRDTVLMDLNYFLLESKYSNITIDFDPKVPAATLQEATAPEVTFHLGQSWEEFVDRLRTCSHIELLELENHGHEMQFVRDVYAHPRQRLFSLWEGLLALEERLGDIFEFKSFDGRNVIDGLVQQAHGYAMMRKNEI